MRPVAVQQSRAIPVSIDDAFRATLAIPLPALFCHWYGPLPPIKDVRDQNGAWGTVGQTRTIALKGGGTMHEELLSTVAPSSFGYLLTDITGALAPLVDRIDGIWSFAPVGTGTEVTWRWVIHPKSDVTRPAVVGIGKLWNGYARGALSELSDQLLETA